MRPVRTHVRIMGYPSAFTHDNATKRLYVRNLSKGPSHHEEQQEGGDPNTEEVDSASVYRVHEYGESIEKFFQEVVAPGVEASLSGQSFTFLLVGPPNSGKSQTMYGDNKNIKGLVALAAEKFLHAMNVNSKVLVTYGNFMTVGNHIQDLSKIYAYSTEVPIKDFPAPLGKMPLPGISVLQDTKSCVLMSRDRNAQASTFAQFHVYKDLSQSNDMADSPVGGQQQPKKGTFATVTFVDLAAFCDATSSPYESKFVHDRAEFDQYQCDHSGDEYGLSPELQSLPKDLIHLHRVVDSLGRGNDGDFSRVMLTTLAQQFLVGPSTLVAIGTLTGVDTLHSKTMATLRFLEKVSKINQLQSLITIVQPAWLEKSVGDINFRLSQREELLSIAKEKAMSDAYFTMKSALARILGGHNRFEGVLEATSQTRLAIAAEQENLEGELSSLLEQKRHRLASMESNWKNTQSSNSHETEELARIEGQIQAVNAKTQALEHDTIAYITSCKEQLADLGTYEDKFVRLQRNGTSLAESINTTESRLDQVEGECQLAMRGLEFIPEYQHCLSLKLEAEVDLQEATSRAAGEPVDVSLRGGCKGNPQLTSAMAEFSELAAEVEELCGTTCAQILASKGLRVTRGMEEALEASGIASKPPTAARQPLTHTYHSSGSGFVPASSPSPQQQRRASTSTSAIRMGRFADPTISSRNTNNNTPTRQQGSTYRTSTSFSPGNKVRSVAASFARTVSNLKGTIFSTSRHSSASPVPCSPSKYEKAPHRPSASATLRSRAPQVGDSQSKAPTHHVAEEEMVAPQHQHIIYDAEEDESDVIVTSGLTARSSHLPLGGLRSGARDGTSGSGATARSCRSLEEDSSVGTSSESPYPHPRSRKPTPSGITMRKSLVANRGGKRSVASRPSGSPTRSATPQPGPGRRAKAPSRGDSSTPAFDSKPRHR